LLWAGTLFSFLGMQMQVLARGYLAYDLTGRNSALGGVMIAFGIPQLLLGLVGGVVADRFPKRTVLWISQGLIAANSAWIASMIWLGWIDYWMLLVAGGVQGAGFAFVGPARQAFIGELVGREAVANAVVLQQLSMNGTRVFGPSVAGVLIGVAFVGVGGVYLGTTIGFAIAMLSMIPLPRGEPREDASREPAIRNLEGGIRYALGRPQISVLLLTSFFIVMLGFPYLSFLPSLVAGEYGAGADALGAISSSSAVGAVIATIFVASMSGSPRVWFLQPLMGAVFGLALIALSTTPGLVAGLAVMFVVGGAGSAFQSLNNSLTMQLTDQPYQGRVMSLAGLSWSFFGFASLPLGFLADAIGLRDTLMIMGALCVLSIVFVSILGRARNVAADRIIPAPIEEDAPALSGGR